MVRKIFVFFCYIFMQRYFLIEVNLFWATHQVHHSAENFNFSTALRQGVLQKFLAIGFYLPMILILPPPIFFIHVQMNLLFQWWVHTEIISNIGPLEFIFNTPSHHRVHHGRNPYCIDKNYGGVLIIWDRLFGTFAAERQDEEIAYGLVHSSFSFDPLKIQVINVRIVLRNNHICFYCSWLISSICTTNFSNLKVGEINYHYFGRVHHGRSAYQDLETINILK